MEKMASASSFSKLSYGFQLEEEGRWITLKVSAAGIKTINKKGLTAALKEAKAPKNLY